jgi:hypothetical protein
LLDLTPELGLPFVQGHTPIVARSCPSQRLNRLGRSVKIVANWLRVLDRAASVRHRRKQCSTLQAAAPEDKDCE